MHDYYTLRTELAMAFNGYFYDLLPTDLRLIADGLIETDHLYIDDDGGLRPNLGP